MKKILFFLLLYGCSLSCITGKDVPQADMTVFELRRIDTIKSYLGDRFLYTWFDVTHKVSYQVYTNSPTSYLKGFTIPGLIRK